MMTSLARDVKLIGGCARTTGPSWLPDANWYEAGDKGDGISLSFEPGRLDDRAWLSWDMILDGPDVAKFQVALRESPDGPAFVFSFGVLPLAQARIRIPCSATDLNRWMFDREGAFLKPLTGGARVDLRKVSRLELTLVVRGATAARWCMTHITVTPEAPAKLEEPLLPAGPLLDALGQSAHREWPGRSRTAQEVTDRLLEQKQEAASSKWPASFSRWGGWRDRNFGGTGFFRTHNDGNRWWLVDPDGHPFWSAGVDCVRVDCNANCAGLTGALTDPSPAADGTVNFLAHNFRRAFGASWHDDWTAITLGHLRGIGFNTIGNWSEPGIGAQTSFPYVRPLHWQKNTAAPHIFRDFPDVFHPDYEGDCREFARQLESTVADPAMIGYFLMNEPTWGFAEQTPAEGMLYNTDACATRTKFAEWLLRRYGTETTFLDAWKSGIGLDSIERGRLTTFARSPEATSDLEKFSTLMVETMFGTLAEACRAVDANHLNLGARYYTVPPRWAMEGMTCFDVFSINCYITPRVRREISVVPKVMNRPVLIGEWHFGSLDAGLPATGIGWVKTQSDRGKAYRIYLEDAASQPWCVGVHWFTLYDQSALGRFDGECYNIGFLDVCNKPYPEMHADARLSHGRLYALASGAATPFADEPEYLPPLFF